MKCRNCQIEYDDKLQACPLCDTPVISNEAADVPGENAHPFEHRCSNCDHVFFGQGVDECPKCHSVLRKPQALETRELFTKDKEYISQEQREQLKKEQKRKKEIDDQILAKKCDKLWDIHKIICRIIFIIMLPLTAKLSWFIFEESILMVVFGFVFYTIIFYGILYSILWHIFDLIYKSKVL